MPTIYRSMKDENGKPALGESASKLGARVPEDIEPDEAGNVHPGNHGMSVSPSLETLPMIFIPRRLRHRFPNAVGNNSLSLWKMGEGIWQTGEIAPGLRLEPDTSKPDQHGFVSPDATMRLCDYRATLASTQDSWSLDESSPTL